MTRRITTATLAAALYASILPAQYATKSKSGDYLVYVGTYTRNGSKGIYAYKFNTKTGKLAALDLAAETPSPSFVTIHPNGKNLYSVSEAVPGQKEGTVSSFTIDKASGKLTKLNTVSSRGTSPCHLVADKTGKTLVVVNYGNGVTTAYGIKEDGSLTEATSTIQHKGASVNPRRQQGPHAHSVNLSADNRYAVVADLGLDEILVYKLDAAANKIEPNDPPSVRLHPGGGPRHFAFHPSGKYAYSNHEMGSYVSVMDWDAARGSFNVVEALPTLPSDFTGVNNTAHTDVHPSGRFVYVSNRGHDSIAVFSVDKKNGTLQRVDITPTQGKTPRNFGIDPTGQYLIAANQDSNNLVVFRIDQKTGRLTPTGQTLENGAPVCVKFLPLD